MAFEWTGKYGQTEINFCLTLKYGWVECKLFHTLATQIEREREREAPVEIPYGVFFDVYTYFSVIILCANQTLETIFQHIF